MRQRNLSKIKRPENYSQLKKQDKSPERTINETVLNSLLDPKFTKEVIKMQKKFRKIMNRNVDYRNKELETIKMNQSKLDNHLPR